MGILEECNQHANAVNIYLLVNGPCQDGTNFAVGMVTSLAGKHDHLFGSCQSQGLKCHGGDTAVVVQCQLVEHGHGLRIIDRRWGQQVGSKVAIEPTPGALPAGLAQSVDGGDGGDICQLGERASSLNANPDWLQNITRQLSQSRQRRLLLHGSQAENGQPGQLLGRLTSLQP